MIEVQDDGSIFAYLMRDFTPAADKASAEMVKVSMPDGSAGFLFPKRGIEKESSLLGTGIGDGGQVNPLHPNPKRPNSNPEGTVGAYTAGNEIYTPTPGLMKALNGKAVAIDFDGTITTDEKGTENPKVRDLVAGLLAQGVRVVIFTARPAIEVFEWLVEHNWPRLEVTDRKSHDFGVYLDDRAVNFTPAMVRAGLDEKLSGFKTWWEKSRDENIAHGGLMVPHLRDKLPSDVPAGITQPMTLSKVHDAGVQPDNARDDKPMFPATAVTAQKAWDESEHPRDPAGSETGGQFAGGAAGGVSVDDTKEWTKDKATGDQERAAKLEVERQAAIKNVEKLVPGVTGQDAHGDTLTSPAQVKDWANMPEEWQTHTQNGYISDYVNAKMPEALPDPNGEWHAHDSTWDQVPQEWKDKGKADYMAPFRGPGSTGSPEEGEASWNEMTDRDRLEYSQQMFNEEAGRVRMRLDTEAGEKWAITSDSEKLLYAQNKMIAEKFPELAVEEDSPDADNEDQPSEMTVADLGEWDALSSDWQDETKEAWIKDNYDEFANSEKESYEPDKDSSAEYVAGEEKDMHEMIGTIPEEMEIYPGASVQGEVDTPEYDAEVKRRVKEWEDNFDVKASVDAGAFTWDNDGELTTDPEKLVFRNNPYEEGSTQQMLPGIDREEMSSDYKKGMWAGVEADYKSEFKEKFDKAVEKQMEHDSETYEPDESSVKDYMEQHWDDMSEKEKFKHAENYLSDKTTETDSSASSTAGSGGPIRVPKNVELFSAEDEKNDGDYKMTGRLGRALTIARSTQIAEERGLELGGGGMQAMSERLWEGWKGSSTNAAGSMLQVAAADELGGNIQPWLQEQAYAIRSRPDFPAAKAYVRGLWETSQYLLHKDGLSDVDVYRGIMVAGSELEKEKIEDVTSSDTGQVHPGRIVEKRFDQNGAASFTTKRSVANDWNGIGHKMPENPKRVVLRARVPATAVLALPAYGRNYHEEQEVVVVGTPWKKWDAWKGKAPKIEDADDPASAVAIKWRNARA